MRAITFPSVLSATSSNTDESICGLLVAVGLMTRLAAGLLALGFVMAFLCSMRQRKIC